MSSQPNTGKAGVIKGGSSSVGKLLHSHAHHPHPPALDMHPTTTRSRDQAADHRNNFLGKLLHRDEKIARASTAAIRVEKLAADTSDSSQPDARPDLRVETDAAIYDDGKVLLKGNPLATTNDILCPRCHLPRLLYPTEGKGAKKPDPSIIYCKKHPYIDKPGFDIYGQTWVPQGPGRGKKKKDMEKKVETTPQDTPGGTPGPEETGGKGGAASRPPNVLSFPSATCSKCKRCILVTRLNNHMGSCIGNSGRNASRAAAQKISNGANGHNGSQNDNTPPNSQRGTPGPGSRAGSPKKRASEEMNSDDDSENDIAPKKKKSKPSSTSLPKKVILKTKGNGVGPKKEKVKGNSLLSVEQKMDDDDAEGSTVEVAPKKSVSKQVSPAKKLKLGVSKPSLSSSATKNGRVTNGSANGGGGGDDAASESSGTLSSPPLA
ncbi:transcriptional activator [Seiridium cupressi]|uniref:Transcriptional activator n=1 Tax=Seiridium unicorne TaxID=138068 RepID=A0ABR2UYJ8_9PEZI